MAEIDPGAYATSRKRRMVVATKERLLLLLSYKE